MIYVDNQSIGKDVWFDNIHIEHYTSEVLEEDHYYPYGLTVKLDQSGQGNLPGQPYKYQGIELEKTYGLEIYETHYRGLDTQLGRFMQVDPKADVDCYISPYAAMKNNPVLYTDPLGDVASDAGDYYGNDGKHYGKDERSDNKAYITTEGNYNYMVNEGGKPDYDGLRENSSNLGVTHSEFQKMAGVIKQEGVSNDANEYLYIAHTNNNFAKSEDSDFASTLNSGYSTVPDKTPLGDNNKSSIANYARAGVINVLKGGVDPTGGATHWDGTDFLAWGLNAPDGRPHNKFEEYKSISISGTIYSEYLKNNNKNYGSSVKYGGTRFSLPAAVFSDKNNWTNGNFNYSTSAGAKNGSSNLNAVSTKGNTIFWKRD